MGPRAASKALAEASKRPDTPCCYLRFYGLLVSVWLRPPAGRCVMRACIRSLLSMGACLGSPVACPWGRPCGRGFWSRFRRGRFDGRHQIVLSGENGRLARGCCLDVSCRCTSEIRLNLATPLWHRPFSVADMLAGRAQRGRKR